MKIAIITTYYPPVKSIASNRMEAMAYYLSQGNQVVVFASGVEREQLQGRIMVKYSPERHILNRIKDLPSDSKWLHIMKVGTRLLLGKFLKDPYVSWKNKTLNKLIDTHQKDPFDILISSYSPEAAHEVAIAFCKKFNEVPWVADMRDEMSSNPYVSSSLKLKLAKIEVLVNEYASAITTVSFPILNDFKNLCPKVKYFEEIRNGYNHEFHRNLADDHRNDIFTLGYFGTFYGQIKPNTLFRALVELSKDKGFCFVMNIYGASANFAIPKEIKNAIHLHNQLSYQSAIEKMAKSDANVLLIPKSNRKGVYSGKLFDYLSVQKPILALVDTTDVAAELIEEMDAGYSVEFDELKEIKEAILKLKEDWERHQTKFGTREQIHQLHRSFQMDRLEKLLNKMVKK